MSHFYVSPEGVRSTKDGALTRDELIAAWRAALQEIAAASERYCDRITTQEPDGCVRGLARKALALERGQ